MLEHSLYPNLIFEVGIHASPAERETLERALKIGKVNSFGWNPEVGQRLKEINPLLIAIDGIGLYYNARQDKSSLRYSFPIRPIDTWISLPNRPAEINPERKVLVIAGDQSEFGETFGDGIRKNPILEKSLNALKLDALNSGADTTETNLLFLTSLAVDAGLATAIYMNKEVSRRRLLKIAIPFAATLTMGAGFLRDRRVQTALGAARAETESDKASFLEQAEAFGPKFILHDFVRFRTAMLIMKTKDAIDVLGLPKDVSAAVLMGASHGFEANAFLSNEGACIQEVAGYFRKLNTYLRSIFENPKSPLYKTGSFNDASNALKEFLASTMVQAVPEPKLEYGPAALQYELPSIIETKVLFQSPRMLVALA